MSVSSRAIQQTVNRILTEDVLSLKEARDELAAITGKRHDKTAIYRWAIKGVGGTKLESIRLGNQILTSRQALTRFITARTEAAS